MSEITQERTVPGDETGVMASLARHGDIALALGVVCVLAVLLLPMPPWMLDTTLAISITFSVMILMTVLFLHRPVEFSSFPTVLLMATMMRLALNVASTRLILTDGHEGTAAAGRVIEAFGNFVMGGNFMIGVVVFAILVIVNFVVITKGAGRIAEVAARFSLDGMPGKQMAIDADLTAGLIEESEARKRREELENESRFFGAMDGASKFVRGDAIAGILITFINVIGGIIIGMAQKDLDFAQASQTYTLLTVGDGLVSQIPAILVSTAAGLLVTKAGTEGPTDKIMFSEIGNYPRSLGLSAVLLAAISLLPGIPMAPFLMLAIGIGMMTWHLSRRATMEETETDRIEQEATDAQPVEEPVTTALAIDYLRLELGYGLLPLINDQSGYRLTDQIRALRRQLASEMGFVMPSVRILDNMQLPANSYVLRVKEIEAAQGELRPNMLLVMDPHGQPIALPGEETTEPTFGLPATWVEETRREEASFRGYTVVDPATVITTHLTEVLKDNMSDLLSYAETQKLLDDLPKAQQKLIADLIPSQITVGAVQRVLQSLLAERVSIRDLPTILEGISDATGFTQNATLITEHVRTRLSRQLSNSQTTEAGYIPLLSLSPEWEQTFADALTGQGEERQLAMAPSRLQEFIASVRDTFEAFAREGELPVMLTSPAIRPYVRSIIERFRPATVVMSQTEIHPKARIRTLGQI